MAYCTVDDVQTYLTTFVLDSESEPTAAQVTKMCTDTSDGVIDPIISRSVVMPVTDPVGTQYLKRWAVNCVLASVYRSIESEPELSVIYDDKCRMMEEAFLNDPGIVSEPITLNSRGEAGGSARPGPVWIKNESQW